MQLTEEDITNIKMLCEEVISTSQYRAQLFEYLRNRMNAIAPNLTAMVGELVGAAPAPATALSVGDYQMNLKDSRWAKLLWIPQKMTCVFALRPVESFPAKDGALQMALRTNPFFFCTPHRRGATSSQWRRGLIFFLSDFPFRIEARALVMLASRIVVV